MAHSALSLPGPDGALPTGVPFSADPTSSDDPTADARQTIAWMVGTLDSRFSPAGQTLAQLVEMIGALRGNMEILEGVFGGGDASNSGAGGALREAARTLRDAPLRQAERGQRAAGLHLAIGRLADVSASIARVLTVLQFYTVNLKIAAAGADEFVEFANDMQGKLANGRAEVEAFDRQVALMRTHLLDMRAVDDQLLRECMRVIPQVPDRLEQQAETLGRQQAWLQRRTAANRTTVARLQDHVGKALGAIQVGDITRQRLEHVHDGCAALEAVVARPAAVDPASTRGHVMRLLGEQLTDLTDEFGGETRNLIAALTALEPDCRQLLEPGGRDHTNEESANCLRALGDCIVDAQAMSSQLYRANAKAEDMAMAVLEVVRSLRSRVGAIEGLRFEVDYMAINVNLRARRDTVIGRPVAVIANEIRSCSRQLADLICAVTTLADELGEHTTAFELVLGDQGRHSAGLTLEAALTQVEQALRDSEAAMAEFEGRARGIAAMIDAARKELSVCGALSSSLRDITEAFDAMAADLPSPVQIAESHPLHGLMVGLARSYTMNAERLIHNRHLLGGMDALPAAPLANSALAVTGGAEDDDGLFDDALF